MSEIMDSIRARAAKLNRHIVLPEGTDERTVRAAALITERKWLALPCSAMRLK